MIALFILASVMYKPLPTPEALWLRWTNSTDTFNARVQERSEAVAEMSPPPVDCINAYNEDISKKDGVRDTHDLQMFAIAEYYELYGDDEAIDRYNDKEEQFGKEVDKVLKSFDKCVSRFADNQKEL